MPLTKSPVDVEAIITELNLRLGLFYRLGMFKARTDGRSRTRVPTNDEELLKLAENGDIEADARLLGTLRIELALCSATMPDPHGRRSLKLSEPLLGYLRMLVSRASIKPDRKRGRDANALRDRNVKIAFAVELVARRGIPLTRNRATSDKGGSPSACSIVAEWLGRMGTHVTERSIEEICARNRQRPR